MYQIVKRRSTLLLQHAEDLVLDVGDGLVDGAPVAPARKRFFNFEWDVRAMDDAAEAARIASLAEVAAIRAAATAIVAHAGAAHKEAQRDIPAVRNEEEMKQLTRPLGSGLRAGSKGRGVGKRIATDPLPAIRSVRSTPRETKRYLCPQVGEGVPSEDQVRKWIDESEQYTVTVVKSETRGAGLFLEGLAIPDRC
jgi:hypothetical protein